MSAESEGRNKLARTSSSLARPEKNSQAPRSKRTKETSSSMI
jgi:hypothetical protein